MATDSQDLVTIADNGQQLDLVDAVEKAAPGDQNGAPATYALEYRLNGGRWCSIIKGYDGADCWYTRGRPAALSGIMRHFSKVSAQYGGRAKMELRVIDERNGSVYTSTAKQKAEYEAIMAERKRAYENS
jgi:hypothetical protein